jgi:hypothetical protein
MAGKDVDVETGLDAVAIDMLGDDETCSATTGHVRRGRDIMGDVEAV